MRRQFQLTAFLVLLINSATGQAQPVPAEGIAAKYPNDASIGHSSFALRTQLLCG